ncbi:MAG TPA: OstA-like protein [Bacteroidia bacterium]|nr:OstA-like protein [Bacteroidia bacterium]
MRRLRTFLLVNFLLLSVILLPAQSSFQSGGKQIQLKHANSLIGSQTKGFQRLIGAVEFEHQGMLMTCDSAHFFQDKNSLDAYGHVHIWQGDSMHVWGDKLKYDGNTRKADLTQNVRLTDAEMTLTTDAITYDREAKLASYVSGGKIISKSNTLTSRIGTYSTEGKTLSFKKDVVLTNPQYVMHCDTLVYLPISRVAYFHGPTTIKATNNSNIIYCENGFYDTNRDVCQFQRNAKIVTGTQTLRGDSIWYNRRTGIGRVIGHVDIVDTTQDVIIRGDLGVHNEITEVSLVTGHALYIQAFEKDSLFLHADTLKSITVRDTVGKTGDSQDTLEPGKLVLGYRHVRIFKQDLQGRCDSLSWASTDSIMHLYGDPVLWSGGNQLTAEKVAIHTAHGEIMQLDMENNAFIISQEDSIRYNQIKGKRMTGYFRDNDLYKIYVEGNGQTLYYAKDNELLIGINRADCSRITILVENEEVKAITFYDEPDATLYPPHDLSPKQALLKDFNWRGKEQPLSVSDLFVK